MQTFLEQWSGWYEQIRRLPTAAVIRFVNLGDKMRRWIGLDFSSKGAPAKGAQRLSRGTS